MQRVKAFDPQTGTITVCAPFTPTVSAGMPYQIARQVPHFENGHEMPNFLGSTYRDLFSGLK
jgi:hypothetical protein